MANKKISELPSASPLTGVEAVEIVQSGINRQTTTQSIADLSPTVDEYFVGRYISVSALEAAHPTGEDGQYAVVDIGVGYDAMQYIWDETDSQWVRSLSEGGGGVTSYNGRTGPVVPSAGDYTASQITNTPSGNISSTTVQAALNELDSEKANTSSIPVKASQAEVYAGTDDDKFATPLRLHEKLRRTSADKTTNYTLQQADDLVLIPINSASSVVITIPSLTEDTQIFLINLGAGAVTFSASGITKTGLVQLNQYEVAAVIYNTSTNVTVIGAGAVAFVNVTGKPTTVLGYGITDSIRALYYSTTSTGNSGATETDLFSRLITGTEFGTDGQSVNARCAGTFAATANNKRLKVVWGATTIFDSGSLSISSAADWVLRIEVIRTSATIQKCFCVMNTSSSVLYSLCDYATASETIASGVTLKVTGTATSTNDIVGELFKVNIEGV